jgi:hypothetical protein
MEDGNEERLRTQRKRPPADFSQCMFASYSRLPTSDAVVCGDVPFELGIEIDGTYCPRVEKLDAIIDGLEGVIYAELAAEQGEL